MMENSWMKLRDEGRRTSVKHGIFEGVQFYSSGSPTKSQLVKGFIQTELPYGLWSCADGSEVLFNRNYNPIRRRVKDAHGNLVVTIPPRSAWILWETQRWFSNGVGPANANKGLLVHLMDALIAFDTGFDMAQFIKEPSNGMD